MLYTGRFILNGIVIYLSNFDKEVLLEVCFYESSLSCDF